MSTKADLDLVKLILKRNSIETDKITKIVNELQLEVDQDKEEKPKPVKKQFAVIVSDPEDKLKGHDLTGWVCQIPEDEAVTSAVEKVHKSAYEFNASPKGQKFPLETMGEAFECLPAKVAKEQSLWIKTKVPVLLVPTKNKISTDA